MHYFTDLCCFLFSRCCWRTQMNTSIITGSVHRLEGWRTDQDTSVKTGITALKVLKERQGCLQCVQWLWTAFIPAMEDIAPFVTWSRSCGLTTSMRLHVVPKDFVICAYRRTHRLEPTER